MNKLNVPRRRYARIFAPDLRAGMNSAIDERVLAFAQGEAAYNVCVSSGALYNGYGCVPTDVSSAYGKVFDYTVFDESTQTDAHYTLAYRTDGKVFGGTGAPASWQEIEGVRFASPPTGVNYRLYGEDVYLLCGDEGMAVIDARFKAISVPNAPNITSVAMHNERMFVTIGGRRNAVWFSDDLDPTNWNPDLDEGGFIELEGERGRLLKAVAFGGYVYVFREFGISRLYAMGAQSDFSVTHLFVSSGKIYADTVAECGDRMVFLAEDGLYSFDGLTATRIARNLDGLIKPSPAAAACYFAGKYYLAAEARAADENGNVLAVLDPRTQTVSVGRGLPIERFFTRTDADGAKLLAYVPTQSVLGSVEKSGTLFCAPLRKLWRSGFTDLGVPEGRKLITDVYLDTAHDCTVTVRTERRARTFTFRGKKEVQHKRVNLIGTKVQLEIATDGDICVARPCLRFAKL